MLGFGLVHGELGAGEFEEARGHPNVIGMHVGKNDLADVVPRDMAFREGGTQSFEGRFRFHAAIDQQITRFEWDKKYVHRFELEGQRKSERKNARINFAKRSQTTPRRSRDRSCAPGVRIQRAKNPFDNRGA